MSIENDIESWIENPEVPEYLKQQIAKMSVEEQKNAFCKEISFGTAGMRGIIAPGPNCINAITIRRATIGYAAALKQICTRRRLTVIIAYDNRHRSAEFAEVAAKVLSESGIDVKCFPSLRPTPLLSFAIRYFKAQGGIMITASHNPKEYNGYKVYDSEGGQMTTANVALVTQEIAKNPILPPYYITVSKDVGTIEILDETVDNVFIAACKSVLLNKEEEKKIKIVFTPQHGTAAGLGLRILEELGYTVYPVKEQMSPDPDFSNTVTPNPEKPEAYIKAIELAKKVGADIILTTDPDADRVGFGYLSSSGEYVLQTGNQTGAALIQYVLKFRQKYGFLPKAGGQIFQSIVTSSLGSRIGETYGVYTRKFLTGFKYIGEAITKLDNSGGGKYFQFGYEESYGYIFRDFCRDKDSIEALAMIAEMANHYLLGGKRMDQVMEKIYSEYGYTVNRNIEFNFASLEAVDAGEKLNILRRKNPTVLLGRNVIKVEDYLLQKSFNPFRPDESTPLEDFPKENVLKYYLDDGCWIAIRPSGTEPKVKFYYECVGEDRQMVDRLPEEFHQQIEELLA